MARVMNFLIGYMSYSVECFTRIEDGGCFRRYEWGRIVMAKCLRTENCSFSLLMHKMG